MIIIPWSWHEPWKMWLLYRDHDMNHGDRANKHDHHDVIMAESCHVFAMIMALSRHGGNVFQPMEILRN